MMHEEALWKHSTEFDSEHVTAQEAVGSVPVRTFLWVPWLHLIFQSLLKEKPSKIPQK